MFTLNLKSETTPLTSKTRVALLLTPLLFVGTLQAGAQYQGHDRDHFYNGARDGSRGAYYDQGYNRDNRTYDRGDNRGYNQGYARDDRRYDNRQGGIGPGKGALIGGAGGAVLGAIFGGGAKGALIGGGVGAGIGAIAGKSHQDHQRDQYYPR